MTIIYTERNALVIDADGLNIYVLLDFESLDSTELAASADD
jgi:hypothetical protein